MYTQGEIRIFSEPLLSCSAFGRLVQGHLKTLCHLSFSSFLYFCESGMGPSQGTESSWFLLTFWLSQDSYGAISRDRIILVSTRFLTFVNLVHLRFSLPLNLERCGARPAPQECLISSSCSVGILSSLRIKIFPSLDNFQGAPAILVDTPPV